MKHHIVRAAIRLAVGCSIPLLIDEYLLKSGDLDELKSCQWAAVTLVMTSEPLLGQFVKKGLERMAGSFVGGLLAMAVASVWINQWYFIAASAVILYVSLDFLTNLGYDYTGKLLAITFLLVLWGTENNDKILWVASTRLLGVIGGVLLGMVLNLVLSPHTATTECVWAVGSSLEALQTVSSLAWQTGKESAGWSCIWKCVDSSPEHGLMPGPSSSSSSAAAAIAAAATAAAAAAAAAAHGSQGREDDLQEPLIPITHDPEQGTHEEEDNEEQLLDLSRQIDEQCNICSGSIDRMTAHFKIAKREYLVGRFRGLTDRNCVYPMYTSWKPLLGQAWQIPTYEMAKVGQEVKRVFRILWSLHLTFNDGFDSATMLRITSHYPPGLFSQLAQHATEAVECVVAVFPKLSAAQTVKPRVPRDALERFSSCMRQFAVVSEFQGLRAAHVFRHKVMQEAAIRKAARTAATASLNTSAAQEVIHKAEQETERVRRSAPATVLSSGHSAAAPSRAAIESAAAVEGFRSADGLPPLAPGGRSPPSRQGSTAASAGPQLLSLASFVGRMKDEESSRAMEGLLAEGWSPTAASSPPLHDNGKGEAANITHEDGEEGIFPLTEEGWILKLRWHNLLFILEELDTDLEDLYDAMDQLLQAMRYKEPEEGGNDGRDHQ